MTTSENRAVSALFRVFGGEGGRTAAEIELRTPQPGMHERETAVFSILIPLTILVAIGDLLVENLGMTAGMLLAPLAAFLALNAIPFLLSARKPHRQWVCWFALCVAWAVFHVGRGGAIGFLSIVWLAVAVMTAAAEIVLAWRALMRLPGTFGVAWRFFLMVFLHLAAIAVGFKLGWTAGILCGAGIAAFGCLAVLRPSCQWLGEVKTAIGSDRLLVTIDDGPDPHDTPVLLDLLDRHQTKAIFFMIGEKVRSYPELAREVVRRGHEIGNHTLTHPQGSFWCAGPWRTRREIEGCQSVIEEITGVKPRWFRAPVGHRNLFTHPVAATLGLGVMGWNRRGFDAVEKDAQKVISRIVPHLAMGDIVLLHEATPIAEEVLSEVLKKVVEIRKS